MAEFPAPEHGIVLTHFIVSDDVERSRRFYTEVLGGETVRSGEPTYVALANSWIIINVGGGPTDDKPTVTLETPPDLDRADSFLNIRSPDIEAVYAEWTARGAEFLTPPKQHETEIRCYLRDPDGHLIEVGQTTRPPALNNKGRDHHRRLAGHRRRPRDRVPSRRDTPSSAPRARSAPSDDSDFLTVPGDIAEAETAQHVVDQALDRFGRIDSLINNAGIFISKPFTEYTPDDFAAITAVNLAGFFHLTQRAIRADGHPRRRPHRQHHRQPRRPRRQQESLGADVPHQGRTGCRDPRAGH